MNFSSIIEFFSLNKIEFSKIVVPKVDLIEKMSWCKSNNSISKDLHFGSFKGIRLGLFYVKWAENVQYSWRNGILKEWYSWLLEFHKLIIEVILYFLRVWFWGFIERNDISHLSFIYKMINAKLDDKVWLLLIGLVWLKNGWYFFNQRKVLYFWSFWYLFEVWCLCLIYLWPKLC